MPGGPTTDARFRLVWPDTLAASCHCCPDLRWPEISVGFSPCGREQGCGHPWIDHLEIMQKNTMTIQPASSRRTRVDTCQFSQKKKLTQLADFSKFFPEEFIKQRSPCPHRIGSVGAKTLYDGQMPWFGIHLRCHLNTWTGGAYYISMLCILMMQMKYG